MLYTLLKVLISAILIAAISEIAKRSSLLGAILASIPLLSVLAMVWLYVDTRNALEVSNLSIAIFWLVIPSLVLFITLPLFIHWQWNFYVAMLAAIVLTVIAYFVMFFILTKVGIKL
jgi:hypothetical protein